MLSGFERAEELLLGSGYQKMENLRVFLLTDEDAVRRIEFFGSEHDITADSFPRISFFIPAVNYHAAELFGDLCGIFPVLFENDRQTFSVPLKYLTAGDMEINDMIKSPDNDSRCNALITAITRYALPFLEKAGSVRGFLDKFEEGGLPFDDRWIVYIISAYCLENETDKAILAAEKFFGRIGLENLRQRICARISN